MACTNFMVNVILLNTKFHTCVKEKEQTEKRLVKNINAADLTTIQLP